jgi:hypothetical protein
LEKKGRREKTLPCGALLSVKERERRRRCAPGPLAHGFAGWETGLDPREVTSPLSFFLFFIPKSFSKEILNPYKR